MTNYTLMRFPGFKRKAVTFSYDDGVKQDARLMSVFDKYGLKGTFNLNAGYLYEPSGNRMGVDEAVALYKDSGHEVAIHGYNHLSLTEVDRAIATDDIAQDRRALEKLFGRVIKGMAYANGAYDDSVVEILKNCGVNYARTTLQTECFDMTSDWLKMPTTCHHKNPKLMQLAKAFVEAETNPQRYKWQIKPMLFFVWGHAYEFDNDDNWEVIEEFAKYISGKDDIWYATNGEIYEYAKAYERLEFSIDGRYIYNPSAIDLYIVTPYLEQIKIKAGERVRARYPERE